MTLTELEELRQLFVDAELDDDITETLTLVRAGSLAGTPVVSIDFSRVIDVWFQTRSVFDATGRFPTICPCCENWHKDVDITPASVVQSAAAIEDCDWILRMRDRFDSLWKIGSWEGRPHLLLDEQFEWPANAQSRHDFYMPGFWGARNERQGMVDVLLPECEEPWMMPALLHATASNDLPDGINQCAMLRRWNRCWGAEPVCCYGSTYELFVARPPTTKDAALRLAYEHAWLCYDRINQSSPEPHRLAGGGVQGLAATLLNSSVWYLWWD